MKDLVKKRGKRRPYKTTNIMGPASEWIPRMTAKLTLGGMVDILKSSGLKRSSNLGECKKESKLGF